MIAKRFEELEAWQLANELKRNIYQLVATSGAREDWKFRDQITDSAASGPANLAEAFGY
jgi:four helix bundle protein